MVENTTHAENNFQTYVPRKKINPLSEVEYGTITITYELPWFSWLSKQKNKKEIIFCFDSNKQIINKKDVSDLKCFDVTNSGSSPCPSQITNLQTGKTFLKLSPSIKKDQEHNPELKILSGHPAYSNIIKTPYNCFYQMQNLDYQGHTKYILGLGCLNNDDKNICKYIFAYNSSEISSNEVCYILLKILCNNF